MKFNATTYWNQRYNGGRGSGPGSEGEAAAWKTERVNKWVVGDVLDLGCGNGQQAFNYDIKLYTGLDVSAMAIAQAVEQNPHSPDWQFFVYDRKAGVTWYPRKTHMSLDVIYHLIDDEDYHDHMKLLFSASGRVIVYSSNINRKGARHVLHRKFVDDIPFGWIPVNFQTAPFSEADWYVFERDPFLAE